MPLRFDGTAVLSHVAHVEGAVLQATCCSCASLLPVATRLCARIGSATCGGRPRPTPRQLSPCLPAAFAQAAMDFNDAPGPRDILIKAMQPLAIEVDVKRRQQDWAFSKSRNLVLDLDDHRVQHIHIASPCPVQSAFLTVAKKPACFLPSLASKPPLPTPKVCPCYSATPAQCCSSTVASQASSWQRLLLSCARLTGRQHAGRGCCKDPPG